MTWQRLLRQATGVEPVDTLGWEAIPKPESDLLPTLADQLPATLVSPRIQGLRRYTWARYQLLQAKAREVFALAPESLLLLDDLYLAGRFYPNPSSRVLHGIDFLGRTEDLQSVSRYLEDSGWRQPPWGESRFWKEWRNSDDLRLRLHTSWLEFGDPCADLVFEEAETWQGFRVLNPGRQLCRCGWQGVDHLWLLDVETLSRHESTTVPGEFEPLIAAWNKASLKVLGHRLSYAPRASTRWTPAQWALVKSHRGRHFMTKMVEELAMELVSRRLFGWPGQWTQALCRRWSLDNGWQIPGAAWSRWKGDWR